MHSKTMKNDLIKSIYDLEEKPENIGRRDFLKKAGIAGLALAGLGSLGGCFRAYRAPPEVHLDFDINSHKKYDSGPISTTKLEDFLLSEEEIYGMRLAWPVDKLFFKLNIEENPSFFLNIEKNGRKKYPNFSWKRAMDAEYKGKTNFPDNYFYIVMQEYNNPKEAAMNVEALEKKIEYMKFNKTNRTHQINLSPIRRLYSRDNFVGVVLIADYFINESHKNENTARLEHYQKKRGLTLHWKNG